MSTGAGTPYFFSTWANKRGVLLDLGLAVRDAGAADHAVGELQEGLVEHLLAVVARTMAGSNVICGLASATTLAEMPCAIASFLKVSSQRS